MVSRVKRGGVIINEHTLTAGQTRRHVEVLGKWFDFIGLDELPQRLAKPGRRPFCLLTFDDGKRSNFTQVAPELARLRVPAVFYVTTEFLSTGTALWFDRHAALIRALGFCPPGLERETLKRLPLDDLRERLDRAFARWGVRPAGALDDEARAMSWEEARGLSGRGFTGSETSKAAAPPEPAASCWNQGTGRVDTGVAGEAEFGEGLEGSSELGVVDPGRVAEDHAAPFEAVDPSLDRGRGKADPLADVAQGAAGVLGEEIEDRPVDGVEVVLQIWHAMILCQPVNLSTFFAQIGRSRHSLLHPARFGRLNWRHDGAPIGGPALRGRLVARDARCRRVRTGSGGR